MIMFIISHVPIPVDPAHVHGTDCTVCGNWKPMWGAGRGGTVACLPTQDGGGEVRNIVCYHCNGTGVEPPIGVWDGVWYKPWTWFKFHYEYVWRKP